MRIAVDAMGGDYAPLEVVKGALEALDELGIESVLVGDEEEILASFCQLDRKPSLEIIPSLEKMAMEDAPKALRQRKGASIYVASRMVKNGEAVGLVSAGSTGATIMAATISLGRIHGIKRPSIATVIPNLEGVTLLLDVGASLEHHPDSILHSALMGGIYAQKILGVEKPRIGLLNVGEEASKGNQLALLSYQKLKECCPGFKNNAEGHDIFSKGFDVIVTDGFVGNIALKVIEGSSSLVMDLFREAFTRGILSRIGLFLLKKQLYSIKRQMDYSSYGGAPLLGVKGNVIIGHGRSKALAIRNAIRIAWEMSQQEVVQSITRELQSIGERAGGIEEEKVKDNRDRCIRT